MDQLPLFAEAARITSLEQTMIDLGMETARAFEATRAELAAVRARLATAENIAMQVCRIESDHGDRLRMLEIRAGIRPKPAVPVHATTREVAA